MCHLIINNISPHTTSAVYKAITDVSEARTHISDHKEQHHFDLLLTDKVHHFFWNQLPTEHCHFTVIKQAGMKAASYSRFNQTGSTVCERTATLSHIKYLCTMSPLQGFELGTFA